MHKWADLKSDLQDADLCHPDCHWLTPTCKQVIDPVALEMSTHGTADDRGLYKNPPKKVWNDSLFLSHENKPHPEKTSKATHPFASIN